jgi:hypothetical protein
VDLGSYAQSHQSRTAAQCRRGRQQGGSLHARCTGNDRHPTRLTFVKIVRPQRQRLRKRARTNHPQSRIRSAGFEIIKRDQFQAAHMIDSGGGKQSAFRRTEGDREIGNHRIAADSAAIGIQPAGEVHRDHRRSIPQAQFIDLAHGGQHRIAQCTAAPDAQQTVENHHRPVRCKQRMVFVRKLALFFPRQHRPFHFGKRRSHLDAPAEFLQMAHRDKGIRAVVAFADKTDQQSRPGEKFPHRRRNPRTGLLHQVLLRNALGKSLPLDVPHLLGCNGFHEKIPCTSKSCKSPYKPRVSSNIRRVIDRI